MRIRALVTLAATGISLSLGGVASAHVLDSEPPDYVVPDHVSIASATHGGSGCPGGSLAASFSLDFQALTLAFDDYTAEVGGDAEMRKKRLFCQIMLQLDFPAGLSFALVDMTYTGWAELDAGISASQSSTYYFQGFQKDDKYTFRTQLMGPFYDNYERTDTLEMLSWSPCNMRRGLNIVTSVQLDNKRNRRGYGMITLDSIEAQVTEIYGVRWRRCPV